MLITKTDLSQKQCEQLWLYALDAAESRKEERRQKGRQVRVISIPEPQEPHDSIVPWWFLRCGF